MVGVIPMLTAAVVDEAWLTQSLAVGKEFAGFSVGVAWPT